MFSVVNVYLDHLKLCVVCVYGRRYVFCGECYVVSNESDEHTSCLVKHIVAHCCEVMYFGCLNRSLDPFGCIPLVHTHCLFYLIIYTRSQ